MAKTGINIKVTNTVLGAPPQVNANSMLIVEGATAVSSGSTPFTLGEPFLLRSAKDLENHGITEENNPDIFKQVNDFYAPVSGVNNSGTILWVAGFSEDGEILGNNLGEVVRKTVRNGFEFRPRNILFSSEPFPNETNLQAGLTAWQTSVDALYAEGFSVVMVVDGGLAPVNAVTKSIDTIKLYDASKGLAPMVAPVIVSKRQNDRASVGAVGGWLASLSVGTSVGDTSLQPFASSMYFTDGTITGTGQSRVITYSNTPCSDVSPSKIDAIAEKQYIFARTRSPRNGLWLNDGATAADPATALSTLEAGRTIAAMVDDLRSYFVPYLNTRVPVDANGDIQSTYKSVVLAGARASVITPYIESGDISEASISLEALNNDFIGTRTWKVTLAILPASTLRWVDGYVFYVKSL